MSLPTTTTVAVLADLAAAAEPDALCDGGLITRQHLPATVARQREARSAVPGRNGSTPTLPAGGVDLGDVERGLVAQAMEQSHGNKSRAARLLGLTRSQLYTRLEKHGLL